MPAKLDACVNKLLAKWKDDPKSKPKLKEGQDLKAAAFGICRSTTKLEQEQEIALEGVGPTLIAAAVTAKPHLRQRGHEIKIVEQDGTKLVEVPLFRKGVYKHPRGKLVFNDSLFDRMIDNHQKRVTDFGVHLDFRHKDTQGALAFLDPDDGGFLEVKDGWLTAYGPPVDEEAEKIINSRKWRYASAEFSPDYESNLVQKLSTDDLETVSQEELLEEIEEDSVEKIALFQPEVNNMPKELTFGGETISLTDGEDGKFVLDQDSLDALVAASEAVKTATEAKDEEVDDLKSQVTTLEQNIAALQEEEDGGEDEIPEAYRLRLEQHETELAELREQRLKEQIAYTLEKAKAYVDDKGRAHSPVLLNLCRNALALEPIKGENGNASIKLENEDYLSYFRNFIRFLLETLPGQMPTESQTQGDDDRMELEGYRGEEDAHYSEEELKKELENFGKY